MCYTSHLFISWMTLSRTAYTTPHAAQLGNTRILNKLQRQLSQNILPLPVVIRHNLGDDCNCYRYYAICDLNLEVVSHNRLQF